MTRISMMMLAVAAAVAGSPAQAGTCQIESTTPPDQWVFIHVYDIDSGELVMGQAIKGADPKQVTVRGERVRVDHKLPGHTRYTTGVVAPCKDGNTLKV